MFIKRYTERDPMCLSSQEHVPRRIENNMPYFRVTMPEKDDRYDDFGNHVFKLTEEIGIRFTTTNWTHLTFFVTPLRACRGKIYATDKTKEEAWFENESRRSKLGLVFELFINKFLDNPDSCLDLDLGLARPPRGTRLIEKLFSRTSKKVRKTTQTDPPKTTTSPVVTEAAQAEEEEVLELTAEMQVPEIGSSSCVIQMSTFDPRFEPAEKPDEDILELTEAMLAPPEEVEKNAGEILQFPHERIGKSEKEALVRMVEGISQMAKNAAEIKKQVETTETLNFYFGEAVKYITNSGKETTKYFLGQNSKGGAILGHHPPGRERQPGDLEGLACFALSPSGNNRIQKIETATAAE